MMLFRKMVVAAAASQIIAQRKIGERLRAIGIAIGLFIISGVLGLVGIIGGIFSIFFALAHVQGFIWPALIAGGISILVAIIIGIEGKKLLTK
ncbi:MAG TPA: phage holin family protein [Candidatus Andersenbacteria bacterium]|nr:phage holin family protein [Candidatus Andersenbacteria bacterium]